MDTSFGLFRKTNQNDQRIILDVKEDLMIETQDTRSVSLDEPVSEGIIKIIEGQEPWDYDTLQETGDTRFFEESSVPMKPSLVTNRQLDFSDWLIHAALKLPKALVTIFAATQFNIARLSSDQLWTLPFDSSSIAKIVIAERARVVSVSPGLIMPRSEVHTSSLLAPSGGYLSWMEMLQENDDGENK